MNSWLLCVFLLFVRCCRVCRSELTWAKDCKTAPVQLANHLCVSWFQSNAPFWLAETAWAVVLGPRVLNGQEMSSVLRGGFVPSV